MYKLSVPIMLHERFCREEVLDALQKCGAKRVFLATGAPSLKPEKNGKMLEMLRENVSFFQSHGMEVGVWFWAFWREGLDADTLDDYLMVNASGEKRIYQDIGVGDTKEVSGFCCPASEKFVRDAMTMIQDIAAIGPDILMLDDDFRFGFYDSDMGCFCNAHMRLYEKKLCRKVSRKELTEEVYAPGMNTVRRQVLEVLGESLEEFARQIRAAVDSVNPKIRVALCSVMSLWDTDGTDSIRVEKILAGNTKPLLRLTGAPYWAPLKNWGNRIQHVIELERMEAAWCAGEDMELMTEGDVYPRFRHQVPASLLEGMDTALRAADVGDGILKYVLNYVTAVGEETGYMERHLKNASIYEQIFRIFDGKKETGVRVYEAMKKFGDSDLSGIPNPKEYVQNQFFSVAARMLSDNTVPTIYSGNDGVGIAFGENARHLPKEALEHGLILDLRAARILMDQGIDVGIQAVGAEQKIDLYLYPERGEYASSGYHSGVTFELLLKEGAEVVTYALKDQKRYPEAFQYQNAEGKKFLVYAFDVALVSEDRYRTYCMQRQLYKTIQWLSGKPLPAKCAGNPDLYILCKKSEEGMAVGLWNFFADDIPEPVVELGEKYAEAEFINCEGEMDGKILKLSPLQPYGFAFINLWR